MKKNRIFISVFLFTFLFSCNENEILKERPLDFLATENSYVTAEDFKKAVTRLHDISRNCIEVPGEFTRWLIFIGTGDVGYVPNRLPNQGENSPVNSLYPTSSWVQYWWTRFYRLIFDANVIIGRIDDEQTTLTEEQRTLYKAEAMFFRAWAHRLLVSLYGSVPIVLEEIKEPKRDFVKASREEVWNQCIEDLLYAAQNLPGPDGVEATGRICNAAAYHLLSECYIAVNQWDNAINAASQVINSGDFELMTERFGSRKDEPGDVWWDLFRRENQNRTSGNREGIWVVQFEYNIVGGETQGFLQERRCIPYYWNLKDPNGISMFQGPMSQYCGRGIGTIKWTQHVDKDIWLSDWDNDMRNSQYNVYRDLVITNPASAYVGKWMVADDIIKPEDNPSQRWYAMYTKFSTPNNHPEEIYLNKSTGQLTSAAQRTYRDTYGMRLAETYLLRAEAYLGKGDKINAAADINMVRNRANASLVNPDEVDIDYILDERLRELLMEEFRTATLGRLGLNYDRMTRFNEYNGDQIRQHHNLWPIPFSEVERNTGAVLEQNPGYN
jgi:starch-binding outer membrane protein, SusD/RagB family